MRKHILWKDIRLAIRKSLGRFFSIAGLMALGSFALVGLKVAGPDMRATGTEYYQKLNVSDLTVIGDYGISQTDQDLLKKVKGIEKVEYGYLKDVTIKDKNTSIRLFSKPNAVSKYEVKKGRMPEKDNEIALDAFYKKQYKIGDTIHFTEKVDAKGGKILRRTDFKIVGFVYSGEIVSDVNLGPATSGTGELRGYGIIMPRVFDSEVYMLARMRFNNLISLDPYSDDYTDKLQAHKNAVEKALKTAPDSRLTELKDSGNATIAKNQKKLDDAQKKLTATESQLKSAKKQLGDGQKKITASENELKTKVADAQRKINEGTTQLSAANNALNTAKAQLAQAKPQLDSASSQLATKRSELATNKQKLNAAQKQLNSANAQLVNAQQQIAAAEKTIATKTQELNSKKAQLNAANGQYVSGIMQLKAGIAALKQQLASGTLTPEEEAAVQAQLGHAESKLADTQAAYETFKTDYYNPGMAQISAGERQLASAQAELNQKKTAYNNSKAQYQKKQAEFKQNQQKIQQAEASINAAAATLANKQALYNQNVAKYQSGLREYESKKQQLATALATLGTERSSGEKKIADAKATLKKKQDEYDSKKKQFDKEAPDARQEIADGRVALTKAKDKLANLKTPTYSTFNRREMAGGDGYKIYTTVSYIIDALANVFPIFLYFVAALVTFTTMGRFVDEERINSGTLRALGYEPIDVTRKFTFYGFMASMIGTIVGIVSGHTLLPYIVYNAYSSGFTLPPIKLLFDPWVTLAAIVLGLVSAVLPAYISAKNELTDQPAELLLPKPPAAGSKILLERIKPIWNRMSFTHKVTARNIFRYKKRMLMTIFGVAGAVSLLFTGWGVRGSIGKMGDTQFNDLIHYNMIVAKNNDLTKDQKKDYDAQLSSSAVKSNASVHYESLTKVAGKNGDTQDITLIVPETNKNFDQYFTLRNRKTKEALNLKDDGAIISERFAKLVDAKVGDTIKVKDADDKERSVKVSGITEMYMGHFIVMSRPAYEKAFKTDYATNGDLILLKNTSAKNVENNAADFMKLSATAGIVQNTTAVNQINTIVKSLDKIMLVLIIVAGMLAMVILFNLTNINVSERIRELSTIKVLGFFNKEVTMYIYRETILLTGIGILAGFAIGDALFQYILVVVPPDQVMFNPSIVSASFIWPTLLIALITVALGWVVNHRLKDVDMLAALASVD